MVTSGVLRFRVRWPRMRARDSLMSLRESSILWTRSGPIQQRGCHFCRRADPGVPHATEILASDRAKALFSRLHGEYDYVIVDLAPLVAGVDVRAASRFIGAYVLVIEWGATTIDAVQYALRHAPGVQANIVGAVLNKVNVKTLSRYDRYGAEYCYGHPGARGH